MWYVRVIRVIDEVLSFRCSVVWLQKAIPFESILTNEYQKQLA